jgi:hypothetical protein
MKSKENIYIHKLFEHLSKDLSILYSRRNDFIRGKGINYCRIGGLYFKNHHKIEELKSCDNSFRLGLEFGINIGIDAFNSMALSQSKQKKLSRLKKSEIDIVKLIKNSGVRKNFILPKDTLLKLKKRNKKGHK